MTDEREGEIKKDLLWDYQQAEMKLEAFRVEFKDAADSYTGLARMLRDEPESFAPLLSVMFQELQKVSDMAKEYKDLLLKNAERKALLIKLRVL